MFSSLIAVCVILTVNTVHEDMKGPLCDAESDVENSSIYNERCSDVIFFVPIVLIGRH